MLLFKSPLQSYDYFLEINKDSLRERLTNIKKGTVNANNSPFCLLFVEKCRTFAHEITGISREKCRKDNI